MHDNLVTDDARRQAKLEAAGITVLCFSADDVYNYLPWGMNTLHDIVRARIGRNGERPAPSPRRHRPSASYMMEI